MQTCDQDRTVELAVEMPADRSVRERRSRHPQSGGARSRNEGKLFGDAIVAHRIMHNRRLVDARDAFPRIDANRERVPLPLDHRFRRNRLFDALTAADRDRHEAAGLEAHMESGPGGRVPLRENRLIIAARQCRPDHHEKGEGLTKRWKVRDAHEAPGVDRLRQPRMAAVRSAWDMTELETRPTRVGVAVDDAHQSRFERVPLLQRYLELDPLARRGAVTVGIAGYLEHSALLCRRLSSPVFVKFVDDFAGLLPPPAAE